MNIGQRIRAERVRQGLTQQALAGSQLSRTLISQVERGRCHPSAKTLAVISKALGLPVESLAGHQRAQDDRKLVNRLLTLSRFSKALPGARRSEILSEALRLSRSSGDSALIARVLEAVGDLRYDERQYPDALAAYQEVASEFEGESRKGKNGAARLQLKTGHCYFDLSQFTNALSHYQRAAVAGITDQALMVKVTRNLGNTCCRLGRFSQAVEHYQESQRLAGLLSDAIAFAHAELGLSYAIWRLGDAATALGKARAAEALYLAENNELGVANSRHNMGVAALDLGRLEQAKTWLGQALVFYRGRNLNDLAAAVHEELARYWALRQDLKAAETECRSGLELLRNTAPGVTSLRLEVMLATIERSAGNPAGDKRLRAAAQGLLDIGQGYELLPILDHLLQEVQGLRRR